MITGNQQQSQNRLTRILPRIHRIRFCIAFVFFAIPLMTIAAESVPRIFIAGDSTASDYPSERAPRAGWGMALPSFFGPNREVRNHALSGRSSRSFIEQGALEAIADELRKGDVLLIQFGHNDEKIEDPTRYTEPNTDFPRWLLHYIKVAREKAATPILITPLARRVFDHGQLLDTHGVYAEAVRDLARREQVGLIDLNLRSMDWLRALGDEPSKRYYMHVPEQQMTDDTHLQWQGATAVACLVVDAWKQLDPTLATDVVRDTACGARPTARADLAAQAYPSIVIHGDESAQLQPGPHGGNGETTAYPYFTDAPDLAMNFRKRVLHRDSGIGLHQHSHDEIYYVLSGRGRYILDGALHEVAAGDVLLTRRDSTHALQQSGDEDLVILIAYPKVATTAP
jgi:lysophospholipase L1-like esterase/quercetin dioxygenase-like cupin family protein